MKTLQFETRIERPAKKVWEVLWGADTYNQWTKFFNPGSRIESDWQVGGRTVFLDDKGNGMISTIESINPPFEVIFKHLGMIQDGVEDLTSDKVKSWSGGLESYQLSEQNGITNLKVSAAMDEAYAEMMTEAFDKGLQTVKELSED